MSHPSPHGRLPASFPFVRFSTFSPMVNFIVYCVNLGYLKEGTHMTSCTAPTKIRSCPLKIAGAISDRPVKSPASESDQILNQARHSLTWFAKTALFFAQVYRARTITIFTVLAPIGSSE